LEIGAIWKREREFKRERERERERERDYVVAKFALNIVRHKNKINFLVFDVFLQNFDDKLERPGKELLKLKSIAVLN
jgi:hypothetical protein